MDTMDFTNPVNEPLDTCSRGYIYDRIRELRIAGMSFPDAATAAFAECGKEFKSVAYLSQRDMAKATK